MNTRASLAVKKAWYQELVEVVESKGHPAWGRSWHWGSQLRMWGGSECTGGRAGKQGWIVHTPPPSCAKQGKKTHQSLFGLETTSVRDTFGFTNPRAAGPELL